MPDGAKQAVLDRVLGYARNHTQITWIGVTQGNFEGHTLAEWAIVGRNGDSLPPETTGTQVSCFELYLLAMLQAGQAPLKKGQTARQFMDAFFLKVLPNDAILFKKGKPGQGWVDGLRGKKPLTVYDHIHDDGSPKRKMPSAGQLVFFNGLAHVCMATGSAVTTMVRSARSVSPEILSFWGPFPNFGEPRVQPTAVYHSTIGEMRDYMIAAANAGLSHSPTTADQYDIRFADPFWA